MAKNDLSQALDRTQIFEWQDLAQNRDSPRAKFNHVEQFWKKLNQARFLQQFYQFDHFIRHFWGTIRHGHFQRVY